MAFDEGEKFFPGLTHSIETDLFKIGRILGLGFGLAELQNCLINKQSFVLGLDPCFRFFRFWLFLVDFHYPSRGRFSRNLCYKNEHTKSI